MDYLTKYNAERRWFNKILIMYAFHLHNLSINNHWHVKDTAKYFGKSLSLTSENLFLGKYQSLIESCATREEALYLLKGK